MNKVAVWVLVAVSLVGFGGVEAAQTSRGKPAAPQGTAAGAARLALVIGNAAYAENPLQNPVNDATDMAAALTALGFEVILKTNLNQRGMKTAVQEFGQRLQYGGGVGLFYFAGHGFQYQNLNYLVPIGAEIKSEADLEYELFHADYVLKQMEGANNGMNIVILDACRSKPPFKRSFSREMPQGLAGMNAPKGAVIALATSPGSTAADGEGRNGVFTKHLLAALRENPCRGISDLLIDVTGRVDAETFGKQTPWQHLSLLRPFALAQCEPPAQATPSPPSTPLRVTPTPTPIARATPTPMPTPKPATPIPSTEGSGVGRLRSEPVTVSEDEFKQKFNLDDNRRPRTYIKNDFEAQGKVVIDHATGLTWQQSGSPNWMSYENAQAYIAELNRRKFGGYADWRLPTVDELLSLMTRDKQSNELYINPLFDKNQTWCWSSDKSSPESAWYVYFDGGGVGWDPLRYYSDVRAVRF